MSGTMIASLTKEIDNRNTPVCGQLMVKYRETWNNSQEQNINCFFNVLFAERMRSPIDDKDDIKYLTAKVRVEKHVFDSTNTLDYLQIYC